MNAINPDATLADLGLDSLMGVEVKQTLERDFDMPMSIQEIRLLTFGKLKSICTDGELFKEKENVKTMDSPTDESGPVIRYDPKNIMPTNTISLINPDTKTDGKPLFIVHPLEGWYIYTLAAA